MTTIILFVKPFFITALLFLSVACFSQVDNYQTSRGHAYFVATTGDGKVIGESSRLNAILDLERREFYLYLEPSTITTGVDSIDAKLAGKGSAPFSYRGRFGQGGQVIDITEHPSLDIEGILEFRGIERKINIRLSVTPIPGGDRFNLLTSADFEIRLSDYGWNPLGFSDVLEVHFGELILRGQR